MKYDLIILGGGPGGVAAGIYAARKKLKSLLITDMFGGQSLVSDDIRNWIGTPLISGLELSKRLEEHLRAQDGSIEIREGDLATGIERLDAGGFRVTARSGTVFETRTLLLTTGSRRRKLNVPGEERFAGKGVMYCATCDAPLFQGKTVAVIGGGNSGLEAVVDLFHYSPKVYLLHRRDALKGDPVTQEKILSNPDQATVLYNAEIQEVLGDAAVEGLMYKDTKTGEMHRLAVQGIFVEIGAMPNSELVGQFVERNAVGEIVVDGKTQRSSCTGIWAAGDVSDSPYKQNNISVGDAIKAVLNINLFLHGNGK